MSFEIKLVSISGSVQKIFSIESQEGVIFEINLRNSRLLVIMKKDNSEPETLEGPVDIAVDVFTKVDVLQSRDYATSKIISLIMKYNDAKSELKHTHQYEQIYQKVQVFAEEANTLADRSSSSVKIKQLHLGGYNSQGK